MFKITFVMTTFDCNPEELKKVFIIHINMSVFPTVYSSMLPSISLSLSVCVLVCACAHVLIFVCVHLEKNVT